MNVSTMTMPVEVAQEKYREYRDAVRRRGTVEDKAIMIGYRALTKGKAIVDVAEAIKAAGLDDKARPKLALANATWADCHLHRDWRGAGQFGKRSDSHYQFRGRNIGKALIKMPEGTFAWPNGSANGPGAMAIVPHIPPSLRPAGKLDGYHILWEADWQDYPVDPMLLKHLGGYLFAVLAVWDLTPIERAVLKGAIARN